MVLSMINYFKISKFFLYLVPLTLIFVTTSILFPFIMGKYVWFRMVADFAFIFFLLGLLLQDKANVVLDRTIALFKRPLVIAMTIFVFVFLLACFFGVNPKMSFWSNFERGEGGLQIFHLYVFFLLCLILFCEEKDWLRIFSLMLVSGFLAVLYGFFAGLEMARFVGPKFGDAGFRFFGSIGNPAYFAACLIFMFFYGGYLLATKYRKRLFSFGFWLVIFALLVFLIAFFAAATRGAFLGLLVFLAAFLSYLFFSQKSLRKLIGLGIIGLLLIFSLVICGRNSWFIKSLPGSRIFDISFSAKTFQDRAIMWNIAIDGWKEKPWLGWGPENYLQVFTRHFDTKYFKPKDGDFGAWFDRAHSIYFDALAETGLLGLLSYLGIFAVFYWQLFKTRIYADSMRVNTGKTWANTIVYGLLFAIPLAYLVQGLVLFDVLSIYLNIFLLTAFAAYKFKDEKNH